MKRVALYFLVLFFTILLFSLALITLIVLELNETGVYSKNLLYDDLKLSLIIVIPQIIVQLLIFYYIKKKGIKIY